MTKKLRMLLRTGLIAIGILFGPGLLFGSLSICIRISRTGSYDRLAIVLPIVLAAVSCALWALVAGHWYVRAWFMALAVAWNLWAMMDVLSQAEAPAECLFALPWLVWTVWFSYRLVQWSDRRKTLESMRLNGS